MDKIRTLTIGDEKLYNIEDVSKALNLPHIHQLIQCYTTKLVRSVPSINIKMLTRMGIQKLFRHCSIKPNDEILNEFGQDDIPAAEKEKFFNNIKLAFPNEEILTQHAISQSDYIVDAYLPKVKMAIEFNKFNQFREQDIRNRLLCSYHVIEGKDADIFDHIGRINAEITLYKQTYLVKICLDTELIVDTVSSLLHNYIKYDEDDYDRYLYHMDQEVLHMALKHTIEMCRMKTALSGKFLNQKHG